VNFCGRGAKRLYRKRFMTRWLCEDTEEKEEEVLKQTIA
jgi:hypothetical protein